MPRLIPFSLHAAGRVAVLLLLAAGTASADCRWPYWGPMATVHTASAVSRVSAIDLTGDGKADLVATGPTQAFVILNNGGGAFGTATPIADGTFSEHLAADFTGDRKTDLLLGDLTTNAPALRLLPGAGNGTFGAPQTFAMPFGPVRLATADFNGDALRDVAIASDTAVAVMLRTASGFSESARVTLAAKPSTLIAPDLDDDGFDDVIAGSINSNLLEAFFGLGNGTLQPVVKLPANTTNDLVPADFDGNGLPDLASSGGYWGVFSRNLTGRLFGDPLSYGIPTYLWAIGAADFTGDGLLDMIGAGRAFVTNWQGGGTGLELQTNYRLALFESGSSQYDMEDLAIADFDGDGRIDVAVTIRSSRTPPTTRVDILRNSCGVVNLTLVPPPAVSAGAGITIEGRIEWGGGIANRISELTGTLTLKEGSTVVATKTNLGTETSVVFDMPARPAGEYTLTAAYSGDDQHDPTESSAVVLRVFNESTTTTISLPADPQYGQNVTIGANVTSTVPGTPPGGVRFTIDGVSDGKIYSLPGAALSRTFTAGPHTITAQYLGTDKYPTSSTTTTLDVQKARLAPTIVPRGSNTAGESAILQIKAPPVYGFSWLDAPAGSMTVSWGEQVLAAATMSSGEAYISLPARGAGRYQLRVRYAGNEHYAPFDIDYVQTIFPAAPPNMMDARGDAAFVRVTWNNGYTAVVRRRTASGPWVSAMCCGGTWWDDTSVQPGTVYLYRMESHDGANVSATDVAQRITFTNDPLRAGTTIKSVHLTEIVAGLNLLRSSAGLQPVSAGVFSPGNRVTASQMVAIRTAINDARTALGAAPFEFTNVVAGGGVIRAAHIQELREAIR